MTTGVMDSMKAAKRQMDDQTIAMDMLTGSKAASSAYFMGVLESPTPELRSMFKAAMSQTMDEYSNLMDLSLNRGWLNPYELPDKQLAYAYRQSNEVVSHPKA